MNNQPTWPRVSVALCTFNGGRFLKEQLESIHSQTRAIDEIVICDDGSTDDTLNIAQTFFKTTRIIRNPQRLGVTKNFEKAISLCTGDVIFLCDQDDRWRSDKVQLMLERLKQTSTAMVFSNAAVVDDQGSSLGYRLWQSIWFDNREQNRVRHGDALRVLLRHAVAAGSTMAFKSEYRSMLLPIPDLPHSHDIWITLLLACVGHIEPIDQDLIAYRLHANNQVGMQQYNFFDQVRMARHQLASNTFAYLAKLNQEAKTRLESQNQWTVSPTSLALLKEKIDHSRRRDELSNAWFKRLPTIGSELLQRNYRKYSYGWKSVLQDLFLR